MKAIYTFVHAGGDNYFVDAYVRCGHDGMSHLWRVAEIVEARSENPGLIVKSPLGINAIEQIISQIREQFQTPAPEAALVTADMRST